MFCSLCRRGKYSQKGALYSFYTDKLGSELTFENFHWYCAARSAAAVRILKLELSSYFVISNVSSNVNV